MYFEIVDQSWRQWVHVSNTYFFKQTLREDELSVALDKGHALYPAHTRRTSDVARESPGQRGRSLPMQTSNGVTVLGMPNGSQEVLARSKINTAGQACKLARKVGEPQEARNEYTPRPHKTSRL